MQNDGVKMRYVCGFAIMPFGIPQVMLITKAKPKWQQGMLNGVGGKIEVGESPIGAMVREWNEETGLHLPRDHWSHLTHQRFLWGSGATVDFYVTTIDFDEALMVEVATIGTAEPVRMYDFNEVVNSYHMGPKMLPVLYNIPYLVSMAYCQIHSSKENWAVGG